MARKNRLQKSLYYGTRKNVVHTAIITAMIVGTILNLINQFPNLLKHKPMSPVKILLNYLTPYMVTTVGAIRMCFQFESKTQMGRDPEPAPDPEKRSALSTKNGDS